jgi:hypothetical protein
MCPSGHIVYRHADMQAPSNVSRSEFVNLEARVESLEQALQQERQQNAENLRTHINLH